MEQVHIIGIDLAKHGFQLHGAHPDGSVAFRKKLTRGKVLGFLESQPQCRVAMEACGSAHYWGRDLPNTLRSSSSARDGDLERAASIARNSRAFSRSVAMPAAPRETSRR